MFKVKSVNVMVDDKTKVKGGLCDLFILPQVSPLGGLVVSYVMTIEAFLLRGWAGEWRSGWL